MTSPTPPQTSDALLDAAEKLFSTRGYADVGIREIAEAAGANIASIKYHFGSKHDLYLATVSKVMTHNGGEAAWGVLCEPAAGPPEAAVLLVRFCHLFLQALIPPGSSVETCSSLIIREALRPGEAFEAVVHEYIEPNNARLLGLLNQLKPDASPPEQAHAAASILGQILHYRVFRPFAETMRGVDLADESIKSDIADHIAAFSLRGLGFEKKFITRAIAQANQHDQPVSVKGSTP